MNPRKLMGRLSAATVRFDVGRGGGMPEITNQDIAASLAFVRSEMDREIFCAVWAPELARLTRAEIHTKLREAVLREYAARAKTLETLRLELHVLECNIAAGKPISETAAKRALAGLRAELRVAKMRRWPGEPAVYAKICAAVVAELAGAMQCPDCGGRGCKVIEQRIVACAGCGGHGLASATDVERARWIGKSRMYSQDGREKVDATTYRATWKTVYEWVRDLAAAAEKRAAGAVSAALYQGDEVQEEVAA